MDTHNDLIRGTGAAPATAGASVPIPQTDPTHAVGTAPTPGETRFTPAPNIHHLIAHAFTRSQAVDEALTELFDYVGLGLQPNIRDAAIMYCREVIATVPPSPSRTASIRSALESCQQAYIALATEGRF